MMEKYYGWSPFAYCLNNPVRNVDFRGDSTTILNLGSGQHMAILIQNDAGKWQYFSVNGDNMYIPITDIHFGGRKFDDIAVGEFDSPQQFLESAYNSKGDKDDKNSNGYEFTEGYIIPTTSEQDNTIRNTFVDISEETYNLITNNCTTAVQKSLNTVGIKTSERRTDVMIGPSTQRDTPWLPSMAFKVIRNNNAGTYIHKQKK
jgi:hypothetical protein